MSFFRSAKGFAGIVAIASTLVAAPVTAQVLQVAEVNLEEALPQTETKTTPSAAEAACAPPALDRQQLHVVAVGESLGAIAQRYGVTTATLRGLNPVIRDAAVVVAGQTLQIPPYDGVQVKTEGQSWDVLAKRYSVPAATLFEQNGCKEPGITAFIPGVRWKATEMEVRQKMPVATAAGVTVAGAAVKPEHRSVLRGYPLVKSAESLVQYGWQVASALTESTFHSGVDLNAAVGDGVFAVGEGTVAFAGEQKAYGNLVVVNHARGLQTRYAHLTEVNVTKGQVIERDTLLGFVGQTGVPSSATPHLHFEVRLNSKVGWVAQDPNAYFSDLVGTRLGLIKLAVSALAPS